MKLLLAYNPDNTINKDKSAAIMLGRFEASGMKQNKVADKMKVHPSYLCDLLQGNRVWSENLAHRLVNALNRNGK